VTAEEIETAVAASISEWPTEWSQFLKTSPGSSVLKPIVITEPELLVAKDPKYTLIGGAGVIHFGSKVEKQLTKNILTKLPYFKGLKSSLSGMGTLKQDHLDS